ncbi:hypothetical protein PMIN01_12167 [Paraphaeosphaeria minitans]|uniref:F-box domain-containing protein n=1 Tax=Paraphaeosphaeria minitans TaxID=565426 RepID=A0A9P6G9N4_9PLEO|nr:hypothetical protein PMIN01_12167 [Paraphaeosphaeria minitans]
MEGSRKKGCLRKNRAASIGRIATWDRRVQEAEVHKLATLHALPDELLLHIFKHTDHCTDYTSHRLDPRSKQDYRTLKALCLTSRKFRRVATELLYSTPTTDKGVKLLEVVATRDHLSPYVRTINGVGFDSLNTKDWKDIATAARWEFLTLFDQRVLMTTVGRLQAALLTHKRLRALQLDFVRGQNPSALFDLTGFRELRWVNTGA